LSGPNARVYFDTDLAKNKNIEVSWMDYGAYKEYPQSFPPFEHGVTILDLLFNTGVEASKFMKLFDSKRY